MSDKNCISTKLKKSKLNLLNYMTPSLYKRLNAIIDIDSDKIYSLQDSVGQHLPEINEPKRVSTIAETEQYALFELHIEPIPEVRKPIIEDDNWMIPFQIKPQSERVVWRSKLYSKGEAVSTNQALVERTENQVDIALEKFCCWFRSVFAENSHITKDYIKKLFSSGFEIHPAAHSIYIEPKQMFSIPHEVAEKYNVPELSTKNQKKKLMNFDVAVKDAASLPIPPTNVAFGKCTPSRLKQPTSVIENNMKPCFPYELQTDEYLFKGIEGLRSTKCLVKHLNKSDETAIRPLYFKNFKYEDDEKFVPLYKKMEKKM